MIPSNLHHFFWDVNVDSFAPAAFPDYTIARILEFGDQVAIHWLMETFPREQIQRVIIEERRLSPRSANFWALAYGIPRDEVAALRAEPQFLPRDERSFGTNSLPSTRQ